MCETGQPPLSKARDCYDWHELRIGTRTDDAKRYGVPLIITEFGACRDSPECVQEIKSVTDLCDKYLASWNFWNYKSYHGDYTKGKNDVNGRGKYGKSQDEGLYYLDGSV